MVLFRERVVVSTIAVMAGAWVTYYTSRDFEFVKFTPFLEEEVERRKREGARMTMKHLDTCTLDYKPEAKQRILEIHAERMKARELEEAKEK